MAMNLEDMGKTVNDARGVTAIVLKQYRKILAARQMLWDWKSIADAMEMPQKSTQISRAFGRISEQLKDHQVVLPSDSLIATSGKGLNRNALNRNTVSNPRDKVVKNEGTGAVDWSAIHEENEREEENLDWMG